MTAFNENEHAMMWGIFGELEMLNVHLARLTELIEHQEQEKEEAKEVLEEVSVAPEVPYEARFTAVKVARRREGRCLICGYTRGNAGKGCYWIEHSPGEGKTWKAHDWPKDEPKWAGQGFEDGRPE